MKFIPHFSVFCANIGFFGETTKFLEEFFQLNVFHQYCVSTISQVVTSIRFLKKASMEVVRAPKQHRKEIVHDVAIVQQVFEIF